MINCQKCGRLNEDRYKFCLGCGAPLAQVATPEEQSGAPPIPAASFLPHGAQPNSPPPRPMHTRQPTPPPVLPHQPHHAPQTAAPGLAPMPPYQAPAYAAPVIAPVIAPAMKTCAQCQAMSPADFLFCGRCGGRFDVAAAAVAPAPVMAAAPVMAPATPAARMADATHPIVNTTVADVPQVRARLTLINPDGTAGGGVTLLDGAFILGRGADQPIFQEDAFVSPLHLRVTCGIGQVLVEDLDSPNGTFLQLSHEPLTLEQEDVIRIGQQLLRFETVESQRPVIQPAVADGTRVLGGPPPSAWGVLQRVISRSGEASDRYMLTGAEQLVGRERGNIVFRQDGFASGQHARFSPNPDGSVSLQDLNSSNGTYLRLRGAYDACDGDLFLIGQRVFQLHIHQ